MPQFGRDLDAADLIGSVLACDKSNDRVILPCITFCQLETCLHSGN